MTPPRVFRGDLTEIQQRLHARYTDEDIAAAQRGAVLLYVWDMEPVNKHKVVLMGPEGKETIFDRSGKLDRSHLECVTQGLENIDAYLVNASWSSSGENDAEFRGDLYRFGR